MCMYYLELVYGLLLGCPVTANLRIVYSCVTLSDADVSMRVVYLPFDLSRVIDVDLMPSD